MAYLKQCVAMQHELGAVMSAASKRKIASYASARFYRGMGLAAQAKRLETQADRDFNNTKQAILQKLEVNGCL